MSFSETLLNQIKDRVSLSSLVSKHTKLVRKGKNFKGCCPFHLEKTASFIVDETNGTYHCFGCQVHGDAISYLVNREGYDFISAVKQLADQTGIELPKFSQPKDDLLYECVEEAALWFTQQLYGNSGEQARLYLKKRSLQESIIKDFRLGFAPHGTGLQQHLLAKKFTEETLVNVGLLGRDDLKGHVYNKFRNRLMFPICNKSSKVIGFGGRILDKGDPKYLNSPETELFHKGHQLYGLDKARKAVQSSNKPFIVCEGYTDVIALHQAGFNTAVAPLGTALTEIQIDLLWQGKNVKAPILCFDGDQAGLNAAYKAAERVLPMIKDTSTLRFVSLPIGDDPASLLEQSRTDDLRALLNNSQNLQNILWTKETVGKNFKEPEAKAYLRKVLLDHVETIKDGTLKSIYRNDLLNRYYDFVRSLNTRTAPVQHNRQRTDFEKKQHSLFILAMIHHPDLLHDFFEDYLLINFQDDLLNELREQTLKKFNLQETLDKGEMYTHLCEMGHQESIDQLFKTLSLQGKFLHPDTPLEIVKKGWSDAWALFRSETLRNERMDQMLMSMQNTDEH